MSRQILRLDDIRGDCMVWRGSLGSWMLLTEPKRVWRVYDPAELRPALDEIFEARKKSRIGGWIAYEAAHYLSELPPLPLSRGGEGWGEGVGSRPLLEFAEFSKLNLRRYLEPGQPLEISELEMEWDRETYREKFDQAHGHLAEGRNYQTNLTFATHFRSDLDAADLFSAWCGVNPPPYASLVRLGTDVISLSPEMFFRMNKTELKCEPMKGTARGDSDPELLRNDPKNRAENLMITDMVRNDMHAIPGTSELHVDLFRVRRHGTVLQMTSAVECEHESDLGEVFRVLFPAASVTGAPKMETMRIISELETSPRSVYCGAIGFLGPGVADFSVPIRTAESCEDGRWQYRIGSGIVWDSSADEEYDECLLKAEVLRQTAERFGLIETFLVSNGSVDLIDGHLERLRKGMLKFGFPFDLDQLAIHFAGLEDGVYRRVFYLDGVTKIEKKDDTPSIVRIPRKRARFTDLRLGNEGEKTTDRSAYGDGLERLWYVAGHDWIQDGGVNVPIENVHFHPTEFTTGNLVVQLEGQLYTPPIRQAVPPPPNASAHATSYQLLPGVARAHWIKTGKLQERVLTMEDLDRAEAVFHLNAARGLRPVEFFDE